MLTQAQVEKLNQAIDLAQQPGACRYESGGKPCCVIGQLAVLSGARMRDLQIWDGQALGLYDKYNCGIQQILRNLKPAELKEYPPKLLKELQGIWDSTGAGREEVSRRQMRSLVLCYATGQEQE